MKGEKDRRTKEHILSSYSYLFFCSSVFFFIFLCSSVSLSAKSVNSAPKIYHPAAPGQRLTVRVSRIRRRRIAQQGGDVEAGTFFYPFFGFYLAVMVQVGAEVAVAADAAAGVVHAHEHQQDVEEMLLVDGAGIGGTAVFVKAAFVADADAMGVVAFGVSAGLGDGAEGFDVAVLTDVEMIACAGEAPAQVVCCQVVFRVVAVAAGSGTVDNDKIDESHKIELK